MTDLREELGKCLQTYMICMFLEILCMDIHKLLKKLFERPPKMIIPIFELPWLARKHIISKLPIEEIIHFSFISEDCKELVRDLNLKPDKIRIKIGSSDATSSIEYYEEKLLMLRFGTRYKRFQFQKSLVPSSILFDTDEQLAERIDRSDMSLRDWIIHFMDILKCENLEVTFSQLSPLINFEYIKKTFKGLAVDTLKIDNCSYEYYKLAVQEFQTIKNLHIFRTRVNRIIEAPIQNLLSKRLEYLCLTDSTKVSAFQIATSKVLNLHYKMFVKPEEMKGFFWKYWRNGSNPDLESLCFNCFIIGQRSPIIFMEKLLEGIEFSRASEGLERKFERRKIEGYLEKAFRGGFDMKRKDGKRATLFYEGIFEMFKICFVIWP
ncbi:hypothetical protein L5515_003010 [Caenorhabditis briggsae]|uniref:F-box domain-containing protein n=1 Tax=Caenorhabditis briggsae TaxID=6238 RepID=A0AAE9J905_CAEBR|nr:hypothetical protein L5515_003010 [Caenorhabditis briggsae]